MPAVKRTAEGKVRAAKKVATQAIGHAAYIATDETRNRSTRTRASYKIRSEALGRVARILAGKE